jgi:UDP-GlcNAc:undecaprenyl-phosphate/decaprenyl-phosphate GlcNAc-1-phosphate transferase
MTFPINVYLAAFIWALVTALIALPFWRGICRRAGLVDDPGGRKIHHTPIPLAGGLAVFTGLAIPLIAGAVAVQFDLLGTKIANPIAWGFGRRGMQVAAILLGAIGMLLLGIADDKWELKAGRKFVGQFLIAVLVAAAGVRVTLFVPNVVFSYFITIFWILTVINAFNFMDNMNGLCTGLGAIAALHFGVLAAARGQYLVALFALVVAGALLGFLPYNFPKASAFLGDSGSHLVGYLLAVLAILPHFHTSENPRLLNVFAPLFILAVPLADLLSVVIYRWRIGKPFYIGDQNHLSHRLVRHGWSQRQTVLFIWLLAAIVGLAVR